jgi:hypothetical protein
MPPQAHRRMKGDAEWEAITKKVAGVVPARPRGRAGGVGAIVRAGAVLVRGHQNRQAHEPRPPRTATAPP